MDYEVDRLPGRQTEMDGKVPWLGNKGGKFLRWLGSSSPSWLKTNSQHLKEKALWAFSLAKAGPYWWTGSTSSGHWQPTIVSFFKLPSPKLGEEKSLKSPVLEKRLVPLCLAGGFSSVYLTLVFPHPKKQLSAIDSVCCCLQHLRFFHCHLSHWRFFFFLPFSSLTDREKESGQDPCTVSLPPAFPFRLVVAYQRP